MRGSSLFILPHRNKTFQRIFDWESPNTFIFDLEDGCPDTEKELARNNIFLHREKIKDLRAQVILRVNPLENKKELLKDLKLLSTGLFKGIMLTKVNDAEDVIETERLISEVIQFEGNCDLHLLIETAKAFNNIQTLASSSASIKSLCLGMHDLRAELNASNNDFTNNFLRLKSIAVARENKLLVTDTPFLDITNFSQLYKRCEHIKMMGMDGALCIHPDHVSIINRSFSISEKRSETIDALLSNYKEGCTISNGVFIGPPAVKKLRQEQKTQKYIVPKVGNSIIPKTFKYGLDLSLVRTGQVINCPYELTIDDSWITSWSSLISMGNYIETSKEYARELGLKDRVLPFSAMVNLTLCMAVEPFSETCLLHLGLEDVRYESPAYPGDTFQCFILIEEMRNTSDGKRSVLKSQHVLLNQKNERIISFQRNTLFPRIENIEQKVQKNVEHSELEKILWNKTDDRIIPYTSTIPSSKGRVSNKTVEEDDLILHDAMRHIGESENLMFTTLYRNTHPIHFNYMRYKPEQIIVCGGFVMAIVLGNAMKDFKQVISQKVINCSHINKVNPGDSLSAASYVYGKVTNGNVETLKMVTLGFIEVDPAKDLLQRDWPIEIFSADTPKPKILEEFLKIQFPELFHKICIHINWEVSRFIM